MGEKLCFVVMGYGVKTDYSTGRQLDLDKTYKNIIKPVANELGLKCIRSDEIIHSGIIDVPMYQYLISADVVIADLSTYNSNAFYELGVRHALRPFTTIAISEKELKRPFDIDHTIIRQYEHLGKDIGYDEAIRFQKELKEAIQEILVNPKTDSPVYTYLDGLQPPVWQVDSNTILDNSGKETLSTIIENAESALNSNDFKTAKILFNTAFNLDKSSTFLIQKLALVTYKSKEPSHINSLNEALIILEQLIPDTSTDPETLGLAGAINKRLWEETKDISYLDKSIFYYEKGFYIENDYYNGINLAYLLNVRGNESSNYEKITDYVLAGRVRRRVIDICITLVDHDFDKRSDQYWILATLEEAYFGLQNNEKYQIYKKDAKNLVNHGWQHETTETQIEKLKLLLDNSPY